MATSRKTPSITPLRSAKAGSKARSPTSKIGWPAHRSSTSTDAGEHEADVKLGKISIASPIARAMIGKEMGDVVEVPTPGGTKAYEILKVEWV